MDMSKQLPRGLVTITWMIIAWAGGYIQARAFTGDSPPPPTGPYRSVPYESAIATPQTKPATSSHASENAQKRQSPQVMNPTQAQAYSHWSREQWESRRKAFEQEQRQRQQAMAQQDKEMQEQQNQMRQSYPPAQWGPPAYEQPPAWVKQQWEAQRKSFAEHQKAQQQAMEKQRKEMAEHQQQSQRNYPPAQWGPRQYWQASRWNPKQWEARRKAFEQHQQQVQQEMEQKQKQMLEQEQQAMQQDDQQRKLFEQRMNSQYPPYQWGPPQYRQPPAWSQPGWRQPPVNPWSNSGIAHGNKHGTQNEDQQAIAGTAPNQPLYPPVPNYYRPAPGYYPPAWYGQAPANPSYWR
jgi:hypothetical protein